MTLYKALYDYESADALDLQFKENDIIDFLYQSSPTWYYGKNIITGSTGLFPNNFVTDIEIQSIYKNSDIYVSNDKNDILQKGDIVIGKERENDYIMCHLLNDENKIPLKIPFSNLIKVQLSNENCGFIKCITNSSHSASSTGELMFSAKDVIWMDKKLNNEFGEGILRGQRGIFPLKKVYFEEVSCKNIDRKNIWMTLFDYRGTDPNDLIVTKGEKLKFLDRIDTNWNIMQNEAGKVGMVPCSYVKNISVHAPPNPNQITFDNELTTTAISTNQKQLQKNFIEEMQIKNETNIVEDEKQEYFDITDDIFFKDQDSSMTSTEQNSVTNNDSMKVHYSSFASTAQNLVTKDDIYEIKNETTKAIFASSDPTDDCDQPMSLIDQFNKREKRVENDIEVILDDIRSIQNKSSREDINDDDIQIMQCNLAFLKEEHKSKLKELKFVQDYVPRKCKRNVYDQKQKFLAGELENIDESDYDSIKSSNSIEKQLYKRSKIIEEILDTEKKFIIDLKSTKEAFNKSALQSKISDQDFDLLFGDLDSVISVSEDFLSKLSLHSDYSVEEVAVGSIFLNSVSLFEDVYKEYCINYDRKLDLISKKSKIPNFSEFINEGLLNLTNMGIVSCALDMMLVKPLQRFLKYPLFLKTIIENTQSCHHDLNDLQTALESFEILAQKINEKKRFEELRAMAFDRTEKWHMKTLHAIQKKPKRVIVSFSGVVQEMDTKYEIAVTNFKNIKKCIILFKEAVTILRDNLKEVLSLYSSITENLVSFLKLQFGAKLNLYLVTCKRSESDYYKNYTLELDSLVINPLNKLLQLFSGPILLIKKRKSRHIDYLAMKQRFDDKVSRIHIDKIEQLKNQYSAINNTLKDELPILTSKATVILNECLANYLQATSSSLQTNMTTLRSLIENDVASAEEEQRTCRNCQNEILLRLHRDLISNNPQQRNSIFKGDFSSCFIAGNGSGVVLRNAVYHQTEEDVSKLKEKFTPDNLARIKKDFIPTKPHQIHLVAGTIVGILKRCNPQGHSSSWLVEVCPKRTGFVPRSYLSLFPFFNRSNNVSFTTQSSESEETYIRHSIANDTFDLMKFSPTDFNVSNRNSFAEPTNMKIRQNRSMSTTSNLIRVAMFNHTSRGESEISMMKNDNLEILASHDKSGRSDWSLVKNLRTGAQGYVPTNYLSK